MAAEFRLLADRDEWLAARRGRIGGSEASAVLGLSPWISNAELYRIKAGLQEPAEDVPNEATKYGAAAEGPLRELFQLDHPEIGVWYEPFNIWTNEAYPWAHASLDGLIEAEGRRGVLEIKTVTIRARNRAEWDGRIPDHYYCQLLHYIAVCELDFGILVAQQKYSGRGDVFKAIREYRIEREEVQEDIDALMEAEEAFWACVQDRREPPLALPGI